MGKAYGVIKMKVTVSTAGWSALKYFKFSLNYILNIMKLFCSSQIIWESAGLCFCGYIRHLWM